MGRPESPITWDGPVAELAIALRALRERAGLSYRDMADDPRCFSRFSLLAAAAAGRTCPSWSIVSEYVIACGERPADWVALWERAHKAAPRRAAPRRPPAAGGRPPTAAPQPPRPAPPEAPNPWLAASAREFVLTLRELRAWSSQRSYYDVAAASGTRLPKSTLYDALNPNREYLPPLEVVRAIVVACGADLATWTHAWQDLRMQEHRQAPLPSRPAIRMRPEPPPLHVHRRPSETMLHHGRGGFSSDSMEAASREPHQVSGIAQADTDAVFAVFNHLVATTPYPDPARPEDPGKAVRRPEAP